MKPYIALTSLFFALYALLPSEAKGAGGNLFSGKTLAPYFTEKEIVQAIDDINNGKYEQALEKIEKVLKKKPAVKFSERLGFLAGFAAFNAGKYQAAKGFLKSLEKKYAPMEEEILFIRGVSSLKLGFVMEAVNDLSRLKSLNADRKEVLLPLIEALYGSNNKKDAFAMLDDYKMRFGADKELKELETKILGKKGEEEIQVKAAGILSAARKYFVDHRNEDVIKIAAAVLKESEKGSDLWCEAGYLTARSYDKQKKYSVSTPLYSELCASCVKSFLFPEIVLNGVKAFARNGMAGEGEKCFADFNSTYPSHSYNDDIMIYFARIYAEGGEREKARKILREQIVKYPDGDMTGEARFMIIWDMYRGGKYKKGLEEVEKAIKFEEAWSYYTNGRLLYWKGRMLEKIKKKKEAEKAYLECMERYPLSYYALLSSSRILKISNKLKIETLYARLEEKKTFERKFIQLTDPETMKNRRLMLLTELFRLGLTGRALAELKSFYNDASVNADDREWLAAYIYDRAGYYSMSHAAIKQSNSFERFYPGRGDGALFYKLLYPLPFREIVEKYAKKHRVDPALVYGIMREESGFNSQIKSWAGAIGLLQLMPATANRMAKGIYKNSVSDKLTDPEVNISLGVKYLGFLTKLLKHPAKVIAAYNAGEGSVISWEKKNKNIEIDEFVEEISVRETRYYVKRVLQSYYRYKYLYGKGKDKYLKLKPN